MVRFSIEKIIRFSNASESKIFTLFWKNWFEQINKFQIFLFKTRKFANTSERKFACILKNCLKTKGNLEKVWNSQKKKQEDSLNESEYFRFFEFHYITSWKSWDFDRKIQLSLYYNIYKLHYIKNIFNVKFQKFPKNFKFCLIFV